MANPLQFSAVFVELDCLLDTRLATLYTHYGPEEAEGIIQSTGVSYLERERDDFTPEFSGIYDRRTKQVLANAVKTPMVRLCSEYVVQTHTNTFQSPFQFIPKIIVNIHPYELNDEEADTIISVLIQLSLQKADIEIVSMQLEDITPTYVKTQVAMMVLYRYDQWLETHSANERLKRVTCPDVTLLGPRLYFKPHNEHDRQIISQLETSPFRAVEIAAGPFIDLKLLNPKYFSAAILSS